MMKKILLVTRPNYDAATSYLFHYAKLVIDNAKQSNIKTIDLKRPRLTKKNFTSIILKQNPSLVFFNAHGNEKIIYGDKIKNTEEILVEENKNHEILSSRIVYARACWSAASLGKACTENSGCFIGYNTPFSFWIDERRLATPLKDNIAKLFLEPSNLIVESLLKRNTAQQSFDKSIDMSKKNILKLLRIKKEPGAIAAITLLWNNMQGQEILGQTDMKFM